MEIFMKLALLLVSGGLDKEGLQMTSVLIFL
jgi:hypothetical protein